MHDFFSPETQPLFEDLVLLPQENAQTGPTGRPPNSYALLLEGRSILFDAPYRRLLPALHELAEEGHPPAALALSHHHVTGEASVVQEATGVPAFLHPADAKRARVDGADFSDPTESALLAEAGLDVISMPYHTEGSIMLYWGEHGGVLLCGDSAVAPGPEQGLKPPRLERPPVQNEAADREQRQFWEDFDRPLRSILPLHGSTYVERGDVPEIMRPLWKAEPTRGR